MHFNLVINRRILALLLIAATLLTCTACKFIKNDEGDVVLVDERYGDTDWALEQLEIRYGEKFENVRSVTGDFSPTQFYVRCDSLDDLIFVEVSHYMENARNKRYLKDNYVAVKYKDEVCNWAKQCCDLSFDTEVVQYGEVSSYALFRDFSSDTDFDTYFKTDNIRLDIQIGIPESGYTSRKQYEAVVTQLLRDFSGKSLDVVFVVLPDSVFSPEAMRLGDLIKSQAYVSKATLDVFSGRPITFVIEENSNKQSFEIKLNGLPIEFG